MPRDLYAPIQAFLGGQAPLRTVESAVEDGADPNSWLGPLTPVRCAVENNHSRLLEALLRLRADPNQRDARGVCPLHMAVFDDRGPCVAALLDGHADVNIRDQHGQTPLFFAPSRQICELLISRRADVDVRNIKNQSPLHLAAHAGLNDAVESLVEVSDKQMLEAKDQKGHTPLYYAAHARLKSTISVLKKMGAEVHNARPNSRRSRQRTPLSTRSPGPLGSTGEQALLEGMTKNEAAEVAPVLEAALVQEKAKSEAGAAEAEEALQAAVEGEDLVVLESALTWARAAGVGPEVLQRGERRAEELRRAKQRKEAEEAIVAAAAAASRPEDLESAMARGREVGVSEGVMRRAEERLQLLKAEEQQRRDAAAALDQACAGDDVLALDAALSCAQAAGVEDRKLQDAAKRLADMRAQIVRRRASVLAIEEASAKEDVEALKVAVSEAGDCGVSEEILEDGRKRLKRLQERLQERWEAVEAMRAAMKTDDLDVLEKAVEQAEFVGVNAEALQPAKEQLQGLQAKDQREKETREAVRSAVEREDVEGLEATIAQAKADGVRAEILQDADEALQSLRVVVRRKREAEEALAEAVESKRIESLELAIARASEAGVGPVILQDARKKLRLRKEAREALLAASRGCDVEALEAAVGRAEAAGAGAEELEDARGRLQSLKEAEAALAGARAGDDMEALEAAIARAEEVGVAAGAVEDARRRLEALRAQAARRLEASRALAAARGAEDAEALEQAHGEAREAGVGQQELEDARQRLEALRAQAARRLEASRALAAARGAEDAEALERALGEAREAGVGQQELEEAEQHLKTLKEQRRSEESSRRKISVPTLIIVKEQGDVDIDDDDLSRFDAEEEQMFEDLGSPSRDRRSRLQIAGEKEMLRLKGRDNTPSPELAAEDGTNEDFDDEKRKQLAKWKRIRFDSSPMILVWDEGPEDSAARKGCRDSLVLLHLENGYIRLDEASPTPEDEEAAAPAEDDEERQWSELNEARRRQEAEIAQRREELRRALLKTASEDDPLALAVALGRAEEAGVDHEALSTGRDRLQFLSSSRLQLPEVGAPAASSWERPDSMETEPPVVPELKDGCLLWDVLLQKGESEDDKFGFVQANGKLDFENRMSGAPRTEGNMTGPQVLIVRRIHPQGLLHRWNLRHPEAQVRPQDRIICVNGEENLEAMQSEIRSSKILMKIMRYPEVFAVTLRRAGRRLGFRIEYPQDADTPEVRVSQLTEGALPVHNAEQVKLGMWHYVVLPDMRIQAANGASGSAWLIAEELKTCEIVTLIVRRAEQRPQLTTARTQATADSLTDRRPLVRRWETAPVLSMSETSASTSAPAAERADRGQ